MRFGRRIGTVMITAVVFIMCLMVALTAYRQSDAMAIRKGAKRRNTVSGDGKNEGKPDPKNENFIRQSQPANSRFEHGGRCPFGFDRPRRILKNEGKVAISNKRLSNLKSKNIVQSPQEAIRRGYEANFLQKASSSKLEEIVLRDNKFGAKNSQERWEDLIDFLSSSSEHVTPVRRRRRRRKGHRGQYRHRHRLESSRLSRWLISR